VQLDANWKISGETPVASRYFDEDVFSGLHELSKSAFPKNCACCGRIYRSLAEFLSTTTPATADSSGLKQDQDADGRIFVGLFRNCSCGSTMLESFLNRRDVSEEGSMRRLQFQDRFDNLAAVACLAEAGRGEWRRRLRRQIFKNAVKPLPIQKRIPP
jgi:hypothetical protein